MDNNQNGQLTETEMELRRQLEEAKAENARLALEMQYRDKVTGLWNRKYIDKVVQDNMLDVTSTDLSVVCADVSNLRAVNERDGANAGDELLGRVATGLQDTFGQDAICCKLVGTKMCALLIASADVFAEMTQNYENLVKSIVESNQLIGISFGAARLADHPDMDLNSLLKEAEFAMHLNALGDVDEAALAAAPVMATRPVGSDATILMIDDSMIILKTLQMMVKDKYKVLMSTSGMEGYEIAKDKKPDLILLDYNMPVVDGERVMQLLMRNEATRGIPVIFVSSVSEKNKILQLAQYKPAGYLLKPVAKDDLLKVIHKVLEN